MLSVEEILLVWLARRLGRAVRWTETRSESMVALQHGRGQQIDFDARRHRDGTVLAYRRDIVQDPGAYPLLAAFLPNLTGLMASGVYAIPRIEVEGRGVVTNTTPIAAFRGAGRPEATQAIERAIDMFAAEIGLIRPRCGGGTSSRRTRSRTRRRRGRPTTRATTRARSTSALAAAGYDELRAEQARRREQGGPRQLGIGVSSYVEITNAIAESEFGEFEITPTATRSSAPARSRTARATRRRSR